MIFAHNSDKTRFGLSKFMICPFKGRLLLAKELFDFVWGNL